MLNKGNYHSLCVNLSESKKHFEHYLFKRTFVQVILKMKTRKSRNLKNNAENLGISKYPRTLGIFPPEQSEVSHFARGPKGLSEK